MAENELTEHNMRDLEGKWVYYTSQQTGPCLRSGPPFSVQCGPSGGRGQIGGEGREGERAEGREGERAEGREGERGRGQRGEGREEERADRGRAALSSQCVH